jgi:hypothetical protein
VPAASRGRPGPARVVVDYARAYDFAGRPVEAAAGG